MRALRNKGLKGYARILLFIVDLLISDVHVNKAVPRSAKNFTDVSVNQLICSLFRFRECNKVVFCPFGGCQVFGLDLTDEVFEVFVSFKCRLDFRSFAHEKL